MIRLFNINNYIINTSDFSGIHDEIVERFEQKIANFVGAKYACGLSSATSAIFLALLNKNATVTIPSIIPPVVCNAIITSGNEVSFNDNADWVGGSYILHDFKDYKIVDSAQRLVKDQYKTECNSQDLMIFSFYPTKPVGGYDGGMIVSDDEEKIKWFKLMCNNGTKFDIKSWKRAMIKPGFKMYLNAIQAFIANENFNKLEKKYGLLSRTRQLYNFEFGLNNTSDHLYRVNVKNRDLLIKKAKAANIELGIHYKALHRDTIYSVNSTNDFSTSEKISETTVSIPFHEKLTDANIEKTIKLINNHGHI